MDGHLKWLTSFQIGCVIVSQFGGAHVVVEFGRFQNQCQVIGWPASLRQLDIQEIVEAWTIAVF